MIHLVCLITITFVFFSGAQIIRESFQQYEGSPCIKLSTGKNGVCKFLKSCPKAIEELRQRQEHPQTCSFVKKEPVVCCENDNDQINVLLTKTPEISRPVPTKDSLVGPLFSIYKRPGEIVTQYNVPFNETLSYRKCKEYEDFNLCKGYTTVVGGKKAREGEYPHMALVGYGEPNNKLWKCGGSLVSERFVLTAGHCLYSSDFGDVKFVRLGVSNKKDSAPGGEPQDFLVAQTYTPRDYVPESRYHDIALLRLDRPAIINGYVKRACIYGAYEIEDMRPKATGWGAVGFADVDSDDLLYIGLQIQPIDSCNASYQSNIANDLRFGIDPDIQLCAGGIKGEDTCQGDSGGPLQIIAPFECSYWIIGVTSFGKACGISNVPGVYTRVAAYRPWIEKVVWG